MGTEWRAVALSAGGDVGRRSPEHLTAQPAQVVCCSHVLINAPDLAQRSSFLIAFTQYLFDSLHDWHLKILLVAAIIRHLAHIFFERLQINHLVVAFGVIVTAEPGSD